MGRRGIALITTLMLAGLLLLLLGAFMQIQRSQFALLGGGADREVALRTIISAHEYCVNKLERDQDWGAVAFAADTPDSDLLGYMTVEEKAGLSRIEGEIPSLHSTFSVDIDNRLTSDDRVVLTITSKVGTLSRVVRSSLRPAPLFDSAIEAGGGVRVSASEWTVGSRDPYRNLVRARGDIEAPDYEDVHFVGKNNSAGETGTDQGIFWAKNDISFFIGASAESVTDPGVLQDAVSSTGGMFFPDSGVNHTVYDLQPSDVVVPVNSSSIQSGEYRFTETTATFENWEQVGTDSDGEPIYDWVPRTKVVPIMGRYSGSLTDYWYTRKSLPSTIRNLDLGLPGQDHPQDEPTFEMGVGAQVEVTLDMPGNGTQPAFNILADGQLKIPGDFAVTSTGDDPQLIFSGASGNSQIEAEGDFTYEGELTGNGIVVSKTGSVRLDLTNAATTGNDLGVSLYAANDIEVNATGGGNLSFSGLLFAGNDVTVNGASQDFVVDGAVVARNGSININTDGKVDLTYNPDHLGVLLEKLPENRTNLEMLVWRE